MNIYFPMGEFRWSHRKFWDGASAGRGSGPTWVEWTTWLYGFLEEPYYVTYVVKLQGNDETDKATDGRTTSTGDGRNQGTKLQKRGTPSHKNRAWITHARRKRKQVRSARLKSENHSPGTRRRSVVVWHPIRACHWSTWRDPNIAAVSAAFRPRLTGRFVSSDSASIRQDWLWLSCPLFLCGFVLGAAATSTFWESEQQCQQAAHLSWVCA